MLGELGQRTHTLGLSLVSLGDQVCKALILFAGFLLGGGWRGAFPVGPKSEQLNPGILTATLGPGALWWDSALGNGRGMAGVGSRQPRASMD